MSLIQRTKHPQEESPGNTKWWLGHMESLWNGEHTQELDGWESDNFVHIIKTVTSRWWAAWPGNHIPITRTKPATTQPSIAGLTGTDRVTSCTPLDNHLELPHRHGAPPHNPCCLSRLSRYRTVPFLTSRVLSTFTESLTLFTKETGPAPRSPTKWLPASLLKFCKEVLVYSMDILYPLVSVRIKLVTEYKMLPVALK